MKQTNWAEGTEGADQPQNQVVQIVHFKFPLDVRQTGEKSVEMRIPVREGTPIVDAEALADATPSLSLDDRAMLVEMIEAYAQRQIIRFSIQIR